MKNGILKITVEKERRSAWDATAYNERFCVIAAVSPQIMQCKLASYYPAGSSVEAATTQSRHHVGRNARAAQRTRQWQIMQYDYAENLLMALLLLPLNPNVLSF